MKHRDQNSAVILNGIPDLFITRCVPVCLFFVCAVFKNTGKSDLLRDRREILTLNFQFLFLIWFFMVLQLFVSRSHSASSLAFNIISCRAFDLTTKATFVIIMKN